MKVKASVKKYEEEVRGRSYEEIDTRNNVEDSRDMRKQL